jgi:hypothetical protein
LESLNPKILREDAAGFVIETLSAFYLLVTNVTLTTRKSVPG